VIIYKKVESFDIGESTSVQCTLDSKTISNLEGDKLYQFQVALRSEIELEVYTGPAVTVEVMLSFGNVTTSSPTNYSAGGIDTLLSWGVQLALAPQAAPNS
jgi:hypothetical protein